MAPQNIVRRPTVAPSGNQMSTSRSTGPVSASKTMPAFTIVAEWRYALTGVGAAMAPGSQTWNGTWADLVAAAMISSTTASVAAAPEGGDISLRRTVPVWSTRTSRPASRTRPPAAVMSSARRAARRTEASTFLWPTRRNDVMDVSSQKTKRLHTESDQTRPSMAVLKAISVAQNLASPAAPAEK